jgi:hypothetical protein
MSFVVLVAANGGSLNLEVVEQLLRLARVFASNAVNALQNVQSPQRDVAKVADRRGNKVEPGRYRRLLTIRHGAGIHE